MKPHLSKRRSVQLAALIMGGLLCASTAEAADLIAATPSDFTDSELGTISGSRVTTHIDAAANKAVMKGLGRDFATFNYHQQGRSMLLARRYNYNTTNLLPSFLLDPNKLGPAAKLAEGITSSVPNAHSVAATDGFIYMTGYDLGQIGVARKNSNALLERPSYTVNLMNDIKQYTGYQFTETYQDLDKGITLAGDPTKAKVHGEGLFIDGKNLYVAASVSPDGAYAHYDDGFLIQYRIKDDGSLEYGSHTRIARNNGSRINKFNDVLMLSAAGGQQYQDGSGNNKHTALSIARLDANGKIVGSSIQTAKIPDAVKALGKDFRDVQIMPNGTAYVMTYNLEGGSHLKGAVYQTTVSNLLSDAPADWTKVRDIDHNGWFGTLNAEQYTKRLWLELGQNLYGYEDGANGNTPTHTWQAKDFSSNSGLYQFNKITAIAPDHVTGPLATVNLTPPAEIGGTAATAAPNPNAVWQTGGDTNTVTGAQTYPGDKLINIGKDKLGDKKTNVLAAIYAANDNISVNAAGHKLNLQVENTVGNPTGIYAGNGKNVTVDAAEVNILTKGVAGGNTLTNAVQLDAAKDAASGITINAPVNISMTGGLGGNGVAVQKSDRHGEKSYEASVGSTIRINGNLKIADANTDEWGIPVNRENVFSRFNNAGILTQVEKSNVTVNGHVDMTVYGNGVTTNAEGSAVRIAGGGSIQVPAGTKYSYYALAAYKGEISMNMGDDGTKPGNGQTGSNIADVKLDGDLFALSTGKLKAALLTNKSYLHGLVDSGGKADLYLKNGAKWINESRNDRYYQDNEDVGAGTITDVAGKKVYTGKSRVTRFYGGDTDTTYGIIYQKDAQNLDIDEYSGHTTVVYEHDAATPTVMKGGDIVVNKAVGDNKNKNVMTLFTDNNGVGNGNQEAVLNALAGKLTYKSHADDKLTGKLLLAEGLTASSARKDITFKSDGKGGYTPPAVGHNTPITAADTTGGTYTLTADERRNLTHTNVNKGFGGKWSALANYNKDDTGNATTGLTVDLAGHNLTLGMSATSADNHYIGTIYAGRETAITSAKALTIKDSAGNGRIFLSAKHERVTPARMVDGLYADKNSIVNIEAPLTITSIENAGTQSHGIYANEKAKVTLKDLTIQHVQGGGSPLQVYGIGAYKSAMINAEKVNISGVKGLALYTLSGGDEHTKISVGGGTITAESDASKSKDYWAVSAMSGKLLLNEGKDKKLTVVGNMQAGATSYNGEIDASFTTADSSWTGAIDRHSSKGKANLTLANGATWTHEVQLNKLAGDASFTTSRLTKFTGGDAADKAGIVRQGEKNIEIDNYGGHTRFIFDHDAAMPSTIKGGNVTIRSAADGSHVTFSTDPGGITDSNVKTVLKSLANKLYYTKYKDGERKLSGTVEVNEGLVSSAAKWAGAISYDNATGQGTYDEHATPSQPSNEQQKTEFTSQITSGSVSEYVTAKVENSTGIYTFTKDSTIKSDRYNGAILGSNTPLTINAANKTLTIEAKKAGNGFLTGVYHSGHGSTGSGNGPMTITAKTLNVNVDGVGKSYGIYNYSDNFMRVIGDTNINVKGGTGDDVTGIEATGGGTTQLDGLTIRQDRSSNAEHRAIRNTGKGSRIFVNMDENGNLGTSKVDIQGNVLTHGEYAEEGKYPLTSLALTTADSKLTGTIHAGDKGRVNLYLQNGSSWYNEHYGTTAGLVASRLTKLTGGAAAANAGNVYMKEAKDLTIANYAGHTNFFFEHDASTPTALKGGNVKIEKAEANSHATMITEHTGVTAANVTDVMKALAKKLYYMDSVDSHNLSGTVKVLEGLTASSAQMTGGLGYIAFGADHRGMYTPTAPIYHDQTKNSFTTPITNTTADTEYSSDNVRKTDGSYVFTQDKTTITTGGQSIPGGPWVPNINAAISNSDTTKPLKIDLKGHDLTVNINGTSHTTGISAIGNTSKVVVDNAGDLTVNSVGTGMDAALFANGGGKITINAKDGKVIKLRTEAANKANGAVVKTMNGASGARSSITINGQVDIEADGVKSNEGLSAVASDIRVAGGTIKATGGAQYAIRAYGEFASSNDGRVYVNTTEDASGNATGAKNNKVVLAGNISTKGEMSGNGKGIVNIGLNTSDSSWTGDYIDSNDGTVNLWMGSGAKWTGKTDTGSNLNLSFLENGARWNVTGTSHVKNLTGSAQYGRSIIDLSATKNTDRLNVGNFSGQASLFYTNTVTTTHDADTDTDVKHVTVNGAEVHVQKAASGSTITLHTAANGKWNWTSSAGAVEQNLTFGVVKQLANKLYYADAAANGSNLALRVQVAEGLTTSSAARTYTKADGLYFKSSGQADFNFTPIPEPVPTTAITRTKTLTKEYIARETAANARDDGGNPIVSALYAGFAAFDKTNPMIVDMNGHNLTVRAESSGRIARAINLSPNAAVEIKNAAGKTLTIKATNSSSRGASAIYAGSNASLKIQGPVVIEEVSSANPSISGITTGGTIGNTSDILINGNLTIKKLEGGTAGTAGDGRNLSALNTLNGKSTITVTGTADIQNVKGSVIKVSGSTGYEAGGTVSIGGGTLSAAEDADKTKNYRVVTQQTGKVNINMNGAHAGTNKTVLRGDMYAVSEHGKKSVEYGGGTLGAYNTPGTLNVALTTADSSWHGAMLYETTSSTRGTGGVTTLKAANTNLWVQNGAQWTNERLSSAHETWKGSHVTAFTGGSDAAHAGVIFQKDANPITIDSYSGNTKVLYAHEAGTPTNIIGGGLTIGKAAANSVVTLTTDSAGLNTASTQAADKNLVSATLNALAKKLYYTAYTTNERNLTGKVEIAEGLTASSASKRIENITFDAASGQGGYAYTSAVDPKPDTPKPDTPKPDTPKPDTPKPDTPKPDTPKPDTPKPDTPKPDTPKPDTPKPDTPKPDTPKPDTPKPDTPKPDTPKPDPKIEYGDYETKLMSGVKSAMTASTMAWRAEANDLMKRMGDLRLSPQDAGVWARVYRGKATSNKDNANFRMNYSTIQVGYDKRVGNDWRVGIAGSYMSGSSSYAAGNGKNKEGNVGIYGTWSGKDGAYVDLIAKIGRLQNEYTLYNDFGHYVKGDYSMWGGSLSAEYGKRIAMKGGSFVEPQVELIYSHMQGKSYVGSTDYRGMSMYVHQKPFDSFIGRVGFGIGKETERSTCYARVSLYHEFAGDMHTDYSDGFTPKSTVQRGSETWVGVQLGGTIKLNDRTNLYGNFEKTFGGDIQTAWRMDAGMRWNF